MDMRLARNKDFRLLRRSLGPAIINTGASNLLLSPQALDTADWSKTNISVSANSVAAPNATTTADMLTATATDVCQITQGFTSVAATVYTIGMFIPPTGTSPHTHLQINNGGAANAAFVTINRTNGAVSAQNDLIGGMTFTAISSKAVGSGWLFWVTFAATHTLISVIPGLSDAANSRNSTSGNTLPLWQLQAVVGSSVGPLDYA